jgi:integrase
MRNPAASYHGGATLRAGRVSHNFRSSFREWVGETREDGREVAEAALAHTARNKAEVAYARSDLLENRRVLMEAWAQWYTPVPSLLSSRPLAVYAFIRSR